MIPAGPVSSSLPIPNLKDVLPVPRTPWNMSKNLFSRVTAQSSSKPYKICEVSNGDLEYPFILKYFLHQKPHGYSIRKIVCIHNPDQTTVFEATLKKMEQQAFNPYFAPQGKEEEPKADRTRVLDRWKSQTALFSPVEVISSTLRSDVCSRAKVLPLWHGSSQAVCQSICASGFTSYGKHHHWDDNAQKGNTTSTDKGYFGSGIYFTNSAHYASMYSQEGHLLLAWVSMREPYPVVNDVPHPQRGSDMVRLGGKEHYQNYNAHYIPVASLEPNNPKCIQYFPCYRNQVPAWDELVVFQEAQALPRFWIELGVDSPAVPLSTLLTVGELLTLVLSLIDKPEVKNHTNLSKALQAKVDELLNLAEENPLHAEDQKLFKLAKRLMTEGDKINQSVLSMLLKSISSPVIAHGPQAVSSSNPPKSPQEVFSLPAVLPPTPVKVPPPIPAKPVLPAIAFGKEKWATYIGDVGVEPPLPPDIEKILKSPCPFFKGKRVEETHLLTLIPKTVNGKPLTLNSLEEFVKHPKKGQATQYRYYWDEIKKQYGDIPMQASYWMLLTKDVIPESRNKKYEDQKQLLAKYCQQAKVPYEVPKLLETAVSLFMEYLQTGTRLYSDSPWAYTRCQERVSKYPDWSLIVGGFAAGGLHVYYDDYESDGVGGSRKF